MKTVFDNLGRKPTKEEIVNFVHNHLMKQGVRSYDEKQDRCLYLGPNNTSCAVGCLVDETTALIWDAEVNTGYGKVQGKSITQLVDKIPSYSWMHEHMNTLMRLQIVHDDDRNWTSMDKFSSKILEIAR